MTTDATFTRARVRQLCEALLCLVLVVGCGDGGTARETTTTTDSASAEPTTTAAQLDPLADRGEVELVDDGYGWSEGPQWMSDAGVLLFTDANADAIYQVGASGEVTVFRQPSGYANGLAVDGEGRLLAAEQRSRSVTRTEGDGSVIPVADEFEGVRLNQPNDIAVRSDGTIYFTDPLFADYAANLDFRGVFRVDPDGGIAAERRGAETEAPNGIVLSPDETKLYVSNSEADLVWIFDIGPDGSLSEARTFVSTGDVPDGMAVDTAGNLFVTSHRGIEVFAPDGEVWGVIPVPQPPANCAFGGADGRTLYITARNGLYRVTLAHPGRY
jgi:sugar lactone lactonase YvrE